MDQRYQAVAIVLMSIWSLILFFWGLEIGSKRGQSRLSDKMYVLKPGQAYRLLSQIEVSIGRYATTAVEIGGKERIIGFMCDNKIKFDPLKIPARFTVNRNFRFIDIAD